MDVSITIIGAGVIGLAIANRLSEKHAGIFVIEKHQKFGQETSSRNSEVVHSGIYYPHASLKAKLCVKGKELLYKTCRENDILFNKCGKLIVATNPDEIDALETLKKKGNYNGVNDLKILYAEQVRELEPNINAIQALFSPSTGIIDTHGLMKHFEKTSIINGVDFAYRSAVQNISKTDGGYEVSIIDSEGMPYSFTSSTVINCAGLEADKISEMLLGYQHEYKIYFCKGEYFRINPPKNHLVKRLIYPVPGQKLVSLGIHSTIDLNGGLKLGPSAFYLDVNIYDYSVNHQNSMAFYQSAKKFLPFIEPEDLSPEMAGIRPKVQAPGSETRDFIIKNEVEKGFKNFINLIGIESPGLTSSMAIADYVEDILI